MQSKFVGMLYEEVNRKTYLSQKFMATPKCDELSGENCQLVTDETVEFEK